MSLDYLKKYLPHVDLKSLENELEVFKKKNHKKNEEYSTTVLNIEKLKDHNSNSSFHFGDYIEIQNSNFNSSIIEDIAKDLIPWRKGPFKINDLQIDSEWKSNLKWNRIKEALPNMQNKVILDIGCNNGYYSFQMLKHNPELVLGIDPIIHNKVQFDFISTLLKQDKIKFELFGIEQVKYFRSFFDIVFSMGIIYHHRNPIEQLITIRDSLKSEGTLILETIGIPGDQSYALFPEDRYSKMRNIWFLPTLSCLKNWLIRSGFHEVEVLSNCKTTNEEQRLTPWCPPPFQSLDDFLDPKNPELTCEGHPAPLRFCLKAKKKKSPKLSFK